MILLITLFDRLSCLNDQVSRGEGVTVQNHRGSLNPIQLIDGDLERGNLRCLIGSVHKRRGDDRAAHQRADQPELQKT